MDDKQKKKVLTGFLLGFCSTIGLMVLFMLFASISGLAFSMGFPAMLIEAEQSSNGTMVHLSWLLPFFIGVLFSVGELLRMI
ncbi:hypothetical protein K8R43_01420 [archaeon]|nr:hypothetical protein [archaeon]